MKTGIQHRAAVIRFNTDAPNPRTMKAEKQPELVWQCLNCYRTYKGPDAQQKALDCCVELLERHISILRTVRDNQPVGLIRLSEMTGIPKHRVRYSLKIMEQQGIIVATPEGAVVSDGYDAFMASMADSVERLAEKVCILRDALR